MSIRRMSDRSVCLEADCDQRDEETSESSLHALRELLDDLTRRIRDGLASEAVTLDSWDGGDYLYVETPLPGAGAVEIDVTIQGGRAVIRIAR